MKRTCKTCDHFDCVGNCLCTDDDCPFKACAVHREREAPACPAWKLDRRAWKSAFLDSLAKAREKHPEFIDLGQSYSDYSIEYLQTEAELRKGAVEMSDCQLRTLLVAEVYAFLFEFTQGDLDRALKEAGDIMAVLYRALNNEGKKKEETK